MKNKENTLGANKQMAFLNTTKLAVLSAMLLLAVFCTIGMSFTPAEEGENIGNPNDSTYVTGPRRGHWITEDNCGNTYHNKTDYGKVSAVATDGGRIEASGKNKKHSTSWNDDTHTLTITWNTDFSDGDVTGRKTDLKARHENTITFIAEAYEGYIFSGWYEDVDCTLKLSDDHEYSRTYTIPGGATYADSKDEREKRYENKDKPWDGGTIYAKFTKVTSVDLTFIAPGERGTIKVTIAEENTLVTDANITKYDIMSEVTLAAEAKDGYIFAGWYTKDSKGQVTEGTLNTSLSKIFAEDCSIGAHFVASTEATFKNITKGIEYYGLRLATKNATSGDVIIPLKEETAVDGADLIPETNTYTIPSGVTLLIPCDNSNSYPDKPKSLESNPALTKYRKLTLDKDIKILVESGATLYVAGQQYGASSGNPGPGCPVGAYGSIDMNQGGEIIVKGTLRAYGFIFGKGDLETTGTITVDGGTVYEDFIIADMHGGGGTAACMNGTSTTNNYELFPLNQYFIQNIEPKMILKNEAEEFAIFNIGGTQQEVELVGSENSFLFQLHTNKKPESTWTKWYDYSRDYICYEVYGEASLNSITLEVSMSILTMTFSSSNFILPITNNMDITLAENTTMHMPTSTKLLPGAKITVKKGAVVDLQKPLYIYDAEEWGRYAMGFGQAIKGIPGHTVRDVSAKDKFEDASLVVNGAIEISENGAIYTTSTGGNITSTGGGSIVYKVASASSPMLYEIYDTYGKKSSGTGLSQADAYNKTNIEDGQVRVGDFALASYKYAVYGTPILCNPACLHNGEEWYKEDVNLEYLATEETPDKTTITYANHHWGWLKIWKDWDGEILKICNTWTETLPTIEAPTDPTRECFTFKEWSTSRDYNKQEIVYTATYTQNTYTITYNAGANGIGTIESGTKKCGEDFTLSTNTFTRFGYIQTGWATTDGGEQKYELGATYAENEALTLYPYWVKNELGPELDIVDADNTEKSLTINATSFALSGWPYTVNGVEYARPADRMLTIPYGDKTPNEEIVIEVKDKKGTVVSCNMYIVPFVYTGTEEMSDMKENSIVFVKSDTLTVGTALAKEIYVAPGAALKVKENSILDVKKLVLRTTPFEAAILTNKGTIAGQVYYSRIARDTDFHLFAIPAGSNTADVVLSDGTSAAVASTVAPYGNAWQLREYNTARRAEEGDDGANWNNIGVNADKITYSDVAIKASKGYELRSGSKYYREYLFPVALPTTATSVQVTDTTGVAGAVAGAAHAGWNILCSPYTYIYTAAYKDPARGIKVSWQKQELDGSYSYIQEQPTQIKPAVPFAYQAMKNGSLDFSADSLFLAPRKQSAAEALTETEWIHLDIYDAYGEGDETSLFVHPTRFEQTYKTGIDMAKQSLTAARPIIYSTHAYGDMAFAGIADSLLENGIDLVVYSPSAQELTFSLRENKFLHRLEYLWLADNETGARTDLLMDDYTCRANVGTIKGRFVLNGRFKAPQIATGIDNTQTDYNIYAIGNNIAISGVELGTAIYIFDAVGHMIYTTAATSDEVIVPAPCAGVYM
ncbi:MAG: InlB B-repeat-containing protein, partial [Paludibacteraceae bacterium]|nr:InlB B-repeat-containing protein [Paludibacteraceae bacterium]